MNSPWMVCIGLLLAPLAAQERITWSKATAGGLPPAAAGDTRPTILYFTFDT